MSTRFDHVLLLWILLSLYTLTKEYRNLSKIGLPLQISLLAPFFGIKLLQRVLFSWKQPTYLCSSTCSRGKKHQIKEQHCARGGTDNEGRCRLLLLHKQAHDKSGIAECLHGCVNRLTACDVGVFSREYHNSWNYTPTLLFEKPLKFVAYECRLWY